MNSAAKNRHIPLDEKLTALQAGDSLRKWASLDDVRICARCNKVISGRMIDVWQDDRGDYHLHCPTSGCPGLPRDWFYHGVTHASSVRIDPHPPGSLGLGLTVSA